MVTVVIKWVTLILSFTEVGDQALGAVADVFKLSPFHLPRLHRQRRMFVL
jgi:hypothetical protein